MNFKLPKSWEIQLEKEIQKSYFKKLNVAINDEYETKQCYPLYQQIFSAFEMCSFEDLRVVIIGQDPYHGKGQANGLCFSVSEHQSHPPSLANIFKEIEMNLNITKPESGNLERWSKQGVLLLNATLTVRANEAGSHQNLGWETFTNAVIECISDKKENIIFLLWGGFAKKKNKLIDTSKHKVLMSGHPSPLSANRGYWFGGNHFSKTNSLLEQVDSEPIDW